MNHYPDLERMRSTVEDLSLKKQLPRRQHTDKPILKYDTSIAKPVQLFNQGDHLVCQDSHGQLVIPHGTPTSSAAQNSTVQSGSAAHQKRARHGSNGSSNSSPSKGVNNPYTRPLSAKEVIEDVQQNQRHRRFQPNLGSSGSSIIPTALSHNSPVLHNHPGLDLHTGAASLQLNSFLRPQSGGSHDPSPTKLSPQKKGHRNGSGVGDTTEGVPARGGTSGKQQAQEDSRNHRARSKCAPPSEQSAKAALHQAFALASTTSASHPAVSGLPPRPKNGHANDSRSNTPTGHQGTVVRNPNYSPNKPYSDINNDPSGSGALGGDHVHSNSADSAGHMSFNNKHPLMNFSGAKHLNGHSSKPTPLDIPRVPLAKLVTNSRVEPMSRSPGGIGSMAGVEESGLPLHNLTASSLLNTKMGMLRKMPVTNTITGTLYYKKSFREASKQVEQKHPVVLEHRPRGDGAPAKLGRAAAEEKGVVAGRADDSEDEEDDDVSTPSGWVLIFLIYVCSQN